MPPSAAFAFQGISLGAAPELVYQLSRGWRRKSLYLVQSGQDGAMGHEPFCKITIKCRWEGDGQPLLFLSDVMNWGMEQGELWRGWDGDRSSF